jgi:hypothetical protein
MTLLLRFEIINFLSTLFSIFYQRIVKDSDNFSAKLLVVINPRKEKGGLTPAVIATMSIYFILSFLFSDIHF